jgi:16S rRNA (guanine527-N7)-methyltransferase
MGSGAGLPGIPLLLARPDIALTLCEPMLRRVAFLELVRASLPLPYDVVRARAEELPRASYDVVVARAVAPLAQLLGMARPALVPTGEILALKGRAAAGEVEQARATDLGAAAHLDVFDREIEGETTTVVRIRWPGPATHRGGK